MPSSNFSCRCLLISPIGSCFMAKETKKNHPSMKIPEPTRISDFLLLDLYKLNPLSEGSESKRSQVISAFFHYMR